MIVLSVWPAGSLLERFPITLPDGRTLRGSLHQTLRHGGRRIVVRDAERIVFDSDDCFDLANARNALERWLQTYLETEK